MARDGVPGWRPQALRAARVDAGWSQKQLGERAGVSRSAIASYERPQDVAPSPGVLSALAKALHRRPQEFLRNDIESLGYLRALAGLSQGEVIERMETPEMTVKGYQAIESGRTHRLRTSDAKAIAQVLNVSVDQVVTAHKADVDRRRAREVTASSSAPADEVRRR